MRSRADSITNCQPETELPPTKKFLLQFSQMYYLSLAPKHKTQTEPNNKK